MPRRVALLPIAVALVLGAISCSGAAPTDEAVAIGRPSPRAVIPGVSFEVAPTPAPTPTPTPGPAWPITVAAVGDVMLARSVAATMSESDPAAPFAGVREILASAALAVANLECAIASGGTPEPKSYTFRAPPIAATSLAAAGVDAVGLANNHSLDYGVDGLRETLAYLSANRVASSGAGETLAAALAPAVLERFGARIAVLGFADVPSEAGYDMGAWAAGPASPGIAWADPETVVAAVAAAAADAHIVIVMVHFGQEYATEPSDAQRAIARAAIDAGADLVVGSHPHVLQPLEPYGGGLIAYSLGNFVFDGFEGQSNETAILRVAFGATGVEAWELIPARIGWDGLPTLVE
jgi:poly-gamma-glutamate synthesis protein (capsule biosynthesis protein)